jgi:hypothetical protein
MRGESLKREATLEFALVYHDNQFDISGEPLMAHNDRVARLADIMARTFWEEGGLPLPSYSPQVETCYHGGLLHSVISHAGATFEEIVAATNLEVAHAVAAITGDNRLPAPRRVLDKLGLVANATDQQQIIVLADVLDGLETCIGLYRKVRGNPTQRAKLLRDVKNTIGENCLEMREYLDGLNSRLSVGPIGWAWKWAVQAADILLAARKSEQRALELVGKINEHRWTIRETKRAVDKRTRKWSSEVRRSGDSGKPDAKRGGHSTTPKKRR